VFRNAVSDFTSFMVRAERRFDPFVRPAFDALLRDALTRFTTALINMQRPNEGLEIAEERALPDEEAFIQSIISSFGEQMRGLWKPGGFERGGNTKTHGIVRGEFTVHDGLPPELRHGIFAKPQTFRAWVRFSGPGPYVTPDIDDVGFMSISIKLMGVPGPKLMDEEQFTQDMFGVSPPTFVTPDTKANAQLQIESLKNAQIFYFVNLHRPHILDLIMQGLWCRTCSGRDRPCSIQCGRRPHARRRFRVCRSGRPTTTCAMRWRRLWPRATSTSTSASSGRPIPT
jgi:hypothetical protein